MAALAEVEERELAEDATAVERRAQRVQTALAGGEAVADPRRRQPDG